MTIDAALNLGLAEPAPPEAAPRVAPGTPKKADDVARRSDDDGRVAPKAADDLGRVTPMMAQYLEIKSANPDCLLFYRMGDFYELFFADAEVASRALGIVLTKRGRHNGEDIRMCGVPVERADDYLQRLIGLGHRVAVCEQTEDPAEAKKRGAKSVVRRDVVRIVTPGTITEDKLLAPGEANLLVAVARRKASDEGWAYGLAALDISTGRFALSETDAAGLAAEIARLEPREIVVPDQILDDPELKNLWRETRAAVTPIARDGLDPAAAERRLRDFFGVATLDSFGAFSRAETAAAGAALHYVERTQFGQRPALEPPRREAAAGVLAIDAATRANLELTRTLAGERAGSLVATIDRTVTPSGARLLAERARRPADRPRRDSRAPGRGRVPGRGGGAARAPARRPARRAGHRPGAVAPGARARRSARPRLPARRPRGSGSDRRSARRRRGAPRRDRMRGGRARGARSRPAAGARGGARRRPPAQPPRRRLRARRATSPPSTRPASCSRNSRRFIAALQARYAAETGCRTLAHQAQPHARLFRRGAGRGRRGVPARAAEGRLRPPPDHGRRDAVLDRRARRARKRSIASAADRALKIELAIFDALSRRVRDAAAPIAVAAAALAAVDVAAALAELAAAENWTRPKVDRSLAFRVAGGRHPVVEAALRRDGVPFIPNDCDLSGDPGSGSGAGPGSGRITLITGPNMGGKSTYLRQNALIVVLAQMGAFVPAREAHIGVVDRLFSRVGAADDLARGRSTFMVEMVETAAILNQASARSLVILDEIGRGTATFDGLSIAWAAIEHLHEENRCRTLFATHFHELTGLAERLPRLSNATLKVTEWEGDVVFLHEVVPGAADRSYGLQVARLAGLPPAVVDRAKTILAELERSDRERPKRALVDDLPLFAAAPGKPATPAKVDPIRATPWRRSIPTR